MKDLKATQCGCGCSLSNSSKVTVESSKTQSEKK
jgi:hypothetical protein